MLMTFLTVAKQHDARLVVLAGLICFLTCYTALTLIARSGQPGRTLSDPWLVAAAVVTGCGIWAVHFVALLAFKPGIPVGYESGSALLAAAIGIVCSGLGFALVVRRRPALGGAMVGAAIAAMNYASMGAMRLPALERWDTTFLSLSLLIGVGTGAVSLMIVQRLANWRGQLTAAFLLASGTLAMHFTGVAALKLIPVSVTLASEQMISPIWFSVAITAICVLILGLGVIGSLVDQHIIELEETKRALETTAARLTEAVETAAAADQAKSRFLATVSHELRTPLNAILGFSEMLKGQVIGPIEEIRVQSYATTIFDSGTHLLNLINDILDISKLDDGHLELNEEEVDLGTVVSYCVELMESAAGKARIEIDATLPEGPIRLWSDERRLRQILLNLVSNALKFTPEGGRVRIAVEFCAGLLSIAVSDTGIGMTAAEIPTALERFGQIDSKLSRKYTGTGLGLPISKHLTELHGGSLAIASEAGMGTTVTILFPLERVRRERKVA